MKTRKPLVISYVRFSTPEQAKGQSLRRQVDAANQWASVRGLSIDETIRDEGVSAYRSSNAKRGNLAAFLKLVENGTIPKASVLIVESLDRLSRADVLTALNQFTAIIKAGVKIVTLMDNEREYDTASINANPMDLMMSILVMQRANEESKSKGKRVGDAWNRLRLTAVKTPGEATTSRCPLWLEVVGGKFVVLADRARIVRRVFDEVIQGIGTKQITKRLTAERIPTFGSSQVWQQSYVIKILHNRAVFGEYQAYTKADGVKRHTIGDPIVGHYPTVIDERTFYAAQASLKQRRGKGGGKGSYIPLLRGLVFDRSGTPLQISDKGYGRHYVGNHTAGLPCESTSGFPTCIFDEALLEAISSASWFEGIDVDTSEVVALDAEIEQAESQIEKLLKALDEAGTVTAVVLKIGELEKRVELLRQRRDDAKVTTAATGGLDELIKGMSGVKHSTADDKTRRDLASNIGRIVKRIECLFSRNGRDYRAEVGIEVVGGRKIKGEWYAINVTPPMKRDKLGRVAPKKGKESVPAYKLSIEG